MIPALPKTRWSISAALVSAVACWLIPVEVQAQNSEAEQPVQAVPSISAECIQDPDGLTVHGSSDGKASTVECQVRLSGASTTSTTDAAFTDNSHRSRSFQGALEQAFPMTPEMVRKYRDVFADNDRAVREKVEPQSLSSSQLVSLEPGASPPVVQLSPGIATALGFYDASGMPWPVRQYVVGDGDGYQIIQLGENSNTLAISPRRRVGWTNMIVALLEEPQPVVMRLQIADDQAHFRSDLHLTRLGPNSAASNAITTRPVPQAGDRELLAIASGTILPGNLTRLEVNGYPVEAWLSDGSVILRTRHPLLSPAWNDSITGSDGVRAYRLPLHSTLLLSVDESVVRSELELP